MGNENLSDGSNDFYGNSINKKEQRGDRFNALYQSAKEQQIKHEFIRLRSIELQHSNAGKRLQINKKSR